VDHIRDPNCVVDNCDVVGRAATNTNSNYSTKYLPQYSAGAKAWSQIVSVGFYLV